uniref:Uncharacterized protein n=1 Tax=uncultured marine virus TaxID=186617 RepID=A0A0F7L3M1_9VIRU|nr:hypothetical protein [uncultured marine virus]
MRWLLLCSPLLQKSERFPRPLVNIRLQHLYCSLWPVLIVNIQSSCYRLHIKFKFFITKIAAD